MLSLGKIWREDLEPLKSNRRAARRGALLVIGSVLYSLLEELLGNLLT
jgi:hypothetical protein